MTIHLFPDSLLGLLLYCCMLFAPQAMGQTNPNFPKDNINTLKYRFFNATGENLESSLNKQVNVNEQALNNDLSNRELSIAYRITEMPASIYNQLYVYNNLSATNGRFLHYVNADNVGEVPPCPDGDFTENNQLISPDDFGMDFGVTTLGQAPDYKSAITYTKQRIMQGELNYLPTITSHETGHAHGLDLEYTKNKANNQGVDTHIFSSTIQQCKEATLVEHESKNHHEHKGCAGGGVPHVHGKQVPIQVNYGTPENPNWISITGKTIMSAGMDPNGYIPVYTGDPNNAVTDADGLIHFTYRNSSGTLLPAKIHKDQLNNGTHNSQDDIHDFLTTKAPQRVHSDPLTPEQLPVAPQITLNGTVASIANASTYHEQLQTISGEYRWYVYKKNNTADGAFISPKQGYKMDENVDLSNFGSLDDLAIRVYFVDGNSLGPVTYIEAPNQAPETPSNLAVSDITPTSATANWSPASDPDGSVVAYKIELNGTPLGETTSTSYNLTELNENTNYTLKVWSKDNEGAYSANFAEKTFTTPETPNQAPETPSNLAVSDITPTSATANWSPASDPDGSVVAYKIELNGTPLGETTSTSYNLTELSQNTNYTLKVWSKDNEGAYSTNFAEKTFTTPDAPNQTPETPSNITISDITPTSASANWSPASDPDGSVVAYKIELNGTPLGETTSTSYNLTGLSQNTDYTLKVWSKDNEGAYSTNFAEKTFHTPESANQPPSAPQNISASDVTYQDATIHWQAANDPDGQITNYKINVNGAEQGTVSASILSYAVNNLLPGQSNSVQVVAVDDDGATASATLEVQTPKAPDTTPPNAIQYGDITCQGGVRHLRFTIVHQPTDNDDNTASQNVAGIAHTEVYVNGEKYGNIPVGATTYEIADLQPETNYTIGFAPVDKAGNIAPVYDEDYNTGFDALHEHNQNQDIKVYPNPTIDFVKIELPDNVQIKNLAIFDASGKMVLLNDYDESFDDDNTMINVDIRGLAKGVYIIRLYGRGGEVAIGRLVVS